MSGNRAGSHPGKISGAAQGGATILVLLGLAAIALGVYLLAFEAARPPSQSSGGAAQCGLCTSWASGLGYGLAIVLVAVGSLPVGVGGWILTRPGPVPLGIGAAIGGGYGGLILLSGGQGSRPYDQGFAIPFVVAALFLLAAILLAIALVNTTPPAREATRGRGGSARRSERWLDGRAAQKPPPGYGTRRR